MKLEVRDADERDLRFVRRTAEMLSPIGIPYGRSVPNEMVAARARRSLAELRPGPDTAILVAYLPEPGRPGGRPVGYLILDLHVQEDTTGEPQSAIYDLGVLPNYWGSNAVRELVHAACRRTAREGLQFMVGEISAHNERTYLQALRLGFELERFQIVMRCSPEGPMPMPERAQEQRAYAQSRAERGRSSSPDSERLARTGVPSSWGQLRVWRTVYRRLRASDS